MISNPTQTRNTESTEDSHSKDILNLSIHLVKFDSNYTYALRFIGQLHHHSRREQLIPRKLHNPPSSSNPQLQKEITTKKPN